MPIIDFHAHLGSRPDQLEELLAAKQRAGVQRTVVVSGNLINTGRLGDFLRGTDAVLDSNPNNDVLAQVAKTTGNELIPFFTIDPAFHDRDDIIEAAEGAFWGFKINTIAHAVDFTASHLATLLQPIHDRGAPLYLHLTLNPVADLASALGLARRFPGIKLVIGHMGFATADGAAIDACAAVENFFLESSIGSVLAFREVRRRRLSTKLLFGSEFPAHDPEIELRKLELVFDEHEMNVIGHENAQHLLGWKQ
jgi:predicted TIM-barrel fold metal-dependent hydrolase